MGGKQSFPKVRIPKERVYIVTGANRGIGYETAKWLAMLGGTVILACRSHDDAVKAMRQMDREYNDEKIRGTPGLVEVEELALDFMELDLASFASTKAFVQAYTQSGRPLHGLICNAGISKAKPEITEDGFEAMLQVNYLSHFLLIGQLLPLMKTSGNDVRIVLVSSDAHRMCRYNLETINFTGPEEKFSFFDYYGRSKLYQVMQMHSLERRLRNSTVSVTSVHPGLVETNIGVEFRNVSAYQAFLTMSRMLGLMKNPAEGATTVINCAMNPELAGVSGIYYKDCKEGATASIAKDERAQEELWTTTMKFLMDHFTEEEVYCLEGADPLDPVTVEEMAAEKAKAAVQTSNSVKSNQVDLVVPKKEDDSETPVNSDNTESVMTDTHNKSEPEIPVNPEQGNTDPPTLPVQQTDTAATAESKEQESSVMQAEEA